MDESIAKKWGVGSYNCFMILTAALNGGLIQIEKDNPDYNPAAGKSKKKIPDPVATAAANAKRRELEEAFREWVWKDEDRAAMLAEIYNRKLNRVAPRAYSGDYLSLPGMSPDIQLRKHQRDAVARIIQDGEGTLIAHTVGAGKTFTGITAMHELKRLGRARKPMIVVPNNLTEQWAADYLKLYPDAKLLVLTDAAAKSPDSVRRFWGQAAAGDWDAVIVGFSRFEKLPDVLRGAEGGAHGAHRRARGIQAAWSFRTAPARRTSRSSRSRACATSSRASSSRSRSETPSKTLEGATFEEIGCDAIFVDEAHYFKNLAVSGGSVPGMQTSDAAKCEDLLMKCEYLRGSGRGSNIVFATGTPVTNTMAELYNMQRYLSPSLLASQGVSNFSAWAKTFGEVTETLEPKPEGGGLDIKRRFARFQNLPELMSSFHCYSDIMTADDLDLDLPELESHAVAVPGDARTARRGRGAGEARREGPCRLRPERGQHAQDHRRRQEGRARPEAALPRGRPRHGAAFRRQGRRMRAEHPRHPRGAPRPSAAPSSCSWTPPRQPPGAGTSRTTCAAASSRPASPSPRSPA